MGSQGELPDVLGSSGCPEHQVIPFLVRVEVFSW